MKAVLIAAGRGTRMRPLTDTRPKPMLPVGGRPLLAHVIEACAGAVDGVVVVTGYKGETIREYFGDSFAGLPIDYVRQRERLGTAHAIDRARDAIDDEFLALNGDVLVGSDLVDRLAAADTPAMTVMPVEDPTAYGVVAVEDGMAADIEEKPAHPPSNLANLGCYKFPNSVFSHIDELEKSPRGEYEITDALMALIAAGQPPAIVEHDGRWLDVGRPWELLAANEAVLESLESRADGTVEEGATLHGPVVVEDGARVRDGAYLEGPVLVQAGADVGPNAYVRGASVIGQNVRVGNAVEVKNSVLMADTAVGHLSYVGDSVLGAGVNFGAGTKVANLRHDDDPVRMTVKGERVDTGRRKLGVVCGDEVKTGINTSLNVGVKLGTGATTRPGETVDHDREG